MKMRFANSPYMVVDADNVDCCEKMSHECPMKPRFELTRASSFSLAANRLVGVLRPCPDRRLLLQ
jgi:hypothetical protein